MEHAVNNPSVEDAVMVGGKSQMQTIFLRGSAPYLDNYGMLTKDSFPYLMLNLPYLCNYRCLKCCNYRNEPRVINKQKPLTLENIKTLLADAGKSGFKVLVLAGEGEPLLSNKFKAIVSVATRNGLIPYIFTNGSLLNHDSISFLAEHKASLVISLDSILPIRYERLTGQQGRLKDVLANIENCRNVYASLQEQTSFGKVVSLAINMVATNVNADEIDNIRQLCSDDIVFVCNRPTRIGLAEDNWESLYGQDIKLAEVDNIIDKYSQSNGPLGSTPGGQWCEYMKHGVSVGYDGSILACAYATDTAGRYGDYKKGGLNQANKLVMDSIIKHYSEFGHSRCILRHPNYSNWIA